MLQALPDAKARLELPLVEARCAAAPTDDPQFGEKRFGHPMICMPVAGAFQRNEGAHAAEVAAELARHRACIDHVDGPHDFAVREVHNKIGFTKLLNDSVGVDLNVGTGQAGEGLSDDVGFVRLEEGGVVLLVAALLALLVTLRREKPAGL